MPWLPRWIRPATRPRVPAVLYTRGACRLCDEMKDELARAGLVSRWSWSEVDVDSDPTLVRRFGTSVPVLEIGGRLAFRGRIRAGTLARRAVQLERAFRERGPGPGAQRELEGAGEGA